MNRSRAAEANKHTLDVCQALIARGGLVKHVVHRGNSFLYVCLPALFDLYMQRHGVFIPSFTAYVRTLSSELVLHDRTHTQRFPPSQYKAAAVAFRWPADRDDLPAADELAELLRLNEQPPQETVAGTESGKITWGRARIQAKPRANLQQQQQQQQQPAVADVSAGGSAVGAAAADGGATSLAGNGHVTTNGHVAPAAATAVSNVIEPDSDVAADQQPKQQQQGTARPGGTSSSSSSLMEGRQQQAEPAPSAAAAAVVPSAAAVSGGAAVVQESPFIGKRGRDDTPEQQEQQHEEQQPAKQQKQMQASDSPGQVTNMLTFPLSSVAVVTQQQLSPSPTQQPKVLRQQTPKPQQALGPGSHFLNQQTSKGQQQQQEALGPGSYLENQPKPKEQQQQQQQVLGTGSYLVNQQVPTHQQQMPKQQQQQQQQPLGPGSHLVNHQPLTQQQQQQTPKRQQPQQALGPGSHLLSQQRPKQEQQQAPKQEQQQQTIKRQQHQQALGPGSHLLNQQQPPVPMHPLPPGMQVQKLQQLQRQPSWLPYQLPPLPLQQQQQQACQQLAAASRPVVKRLPAGMRVGGMSNEERLQLLTWLLKGRPERLQQLKLQQQGAAATDAEAGRMRRSQSGQLVQSQQQQQQQQALSASQVQMLQASLRKRQRELSQQQQTSALCTGLAAAGFADMQSEADAAAAGGASTTQQQQQQQDEEDGGVQLGSTFEAQQEVERLQQELQQLQSLLLNEGQAQHGQQQLLEQPAVAMQQEPRKRKAPEPAMQEQQQQQGLPHANRLQQQQGGGKVQRLRSGPLAPSVLRTADRAEVQALLTAMCVVSGAADVQQLVAGIDIQLRSSSSNGNAAATGVISEQQQQQQEQQEASDTDRQVLRELRCLALAFGQQGLRVPSLLDLTQDVPCLLEGVAALDGQQLLCLSETQLQGFLAAVECSELQRAVHAAQQAAGCRNHQQQQQQQQQEPLKPPTSRGAAAAGFSGSSLVQLQQQLAAELMSAYRSASGQILVRPHSLMMLTAQRLMTAAQQVPQLSPLQQTPLAAAVAGCLADREVQLLQSREQGAAVTGLHLLNAFMLRRKFDHKLAGQRQLVLDLPAQCAVLAAASGTSSQLHLSTVSAAVFAYPLLQEQQVLAGAAEEASSAVLSSWLFVAPQLFVWQQLVCGLKQLRQQQRADQQQQQQEEEEEGNAEQLGSLQECSVQAEKLLQELCLQPQHLAWLQQQLTTPPAGSKHKSVPQPAASDELQQQQQQHVAVLLQQKAGQAVLTKPGWMHVVVNHAANVKVCVEGVGPSNVAACAVAQHELQQGSGEELASIQLGPVVLTVLQQWCAYCRQQERQLQQQ